jgi:hypothetical protein
LLQSYPAELSRVKFNATQDQLGFLLKQAGERVVEFFRDFSNTSAKERVRMQRYLQVITPWQIRSQPMLIQQSQMTPTAPSVDASGRTALRPYLPNIMSFKEHSAEFNYLILPGSGRSETELVEDRTGKNNRPIDPTAMSGFIMSSGHAGKCLYLHPGHQPNSDFRYLGRDDSYDRAHVIAFSQKPESGDYLAQYSETKSSPPIRFLVQGFVWLHPATFQILRIRTELLLPEVSSSLKETITDIRYEKLLFDRRGREFWLPREINVSWELLYSDKLSWVYRNQHQYSDYHLFTVDTDYKINQTEADRNN